MCPAARVLANGARRAQGSLHAFCPESCVRLAWRPGCAGAPLVLTPRALCAQQSSSETAASPGMSLRPSIGRGKPSAPNVFGNCPLEGIGRRAFQAVSGLLKMRPGATCRISEASGTGSALGGENCCENCCDDWPGRLQNLATRALGNIRLPTDERRRRARPADTRELQRRCVFHHAAFRD